MLKNKILKLRSEGKTYDEIVKILKCSKGTVSYYCGQSQKEKTKLRQRKNRSKQHPFIRKIQTFQYRKPYTTKYKRSGKLYKYIYDKIRSFFRMSNKENPSSIPITVEQVLEHIGDEPKCYLTGKPIDINKPQSYHFDHVIPHSKGGSNTLDNLGVCSREANLAKHDMTPDEFIQLCKNVLTHNGYQISK